MGERFDTRQDTGREHSFRARLGGRLGGLGIRGAAAEQDGYDDAPGAYPDIHATLDDIEAASVAPAMLEPDSQQAVQLVQGLQHDKPLGRPVFLEQRVRGDSTRVATILATPDKPVRLPVGNFVSAAGMHDWEQGRGTKESAKKIRDYVRQGKRSEAPPIGMAVAYVQPDGRTLFAAVEEGAHRLTAAHKRGDKTILVGGQVDVRRLHENVLPVDAP